MQTKTFLKISISEESTCEILLQGSTGTEVVAFGL